MLAAKSARSMGRRAPASASSSARDKLFSRTAFCRPVFLLQVLGFAPPAWGPEGGNERLIHRDQNLPSRFAGSGWGINPERARWPRRMQFNKEVVWLTSP